MSERRLELMLPVDVLEAIAGRAAELVLERQRVASPSQLMTVPEAADFLRAKPQRVYDLLSDGRLTRRKDGRRVFVDRQELERYVAGSGGRRHL